MVLEEQRDRRSSGSLPSFVADIVEQRVPAGAGGLGRVLSRSREVRRGWAVGCTENMGRSEGRAAALGSRLKDLFLRTESKRKICCSSLLQMTLLLTFLII